MSFTQLLTVSALIAIHLQFAAAQFIQCPGGWTSPSNDWNYCYLLKLEEATQRVAMTNCLKENANLASIHSDSENNHIKGMVPGGSNAFTGGMTFGNDIGFRWTDGSSYTYTQKKGNPGVTGRCYITDNTGEWKLGGCGTKRPYICKKPRNIDELSTEPCNIAKGWSHGDNGCYKIFNSKKSKNAAQEVCENDNGNLVSILSASENAYVNALSGYNKGIYGGGVSEGAPNYEWTDKSELKYNLSLPTVHVDGQCFSMSITADGIIWAAGDCTTELPFVCKTSDDSCVDKSEDCKKLKPNCFIGGKIYEVMASNCAKTCGYCNCENTANSLSCNKVQNRCWGNSKVIRKLNKVCKRMCQMCGCRDTIDCQGMATFCDSEEIEDQLREKCAETCGLCTKPKKNMN